MQAMPPTFRLYWCSWIEIINNYVPMNFGESDGFALACLLLSDNFCLQLPERHVICCISCLVTAAAADRGRHITCILIPVMIQMTPCPHMMTLSKMRSWDLWGIFDPGTHSKPARPWAMSEQRATRALATTSNNKQQTTEHLLLAWRSAQWIERWIDNLMPSIISYQRCC